MTADLLARALPMLERLGDFIGNGPVDPARPGSLGARCDLILDIRHALDPTADTQPVGFYVSEDLDGATWSVYAERYYGTDGDAVDGTQRRIAAGLPSAEVAEACASALLAAGAIEHDCPRAGGEPTAGEHRHDFEGQALVHSHDGGDRPHGYYGHAEDQGDICDRCKVNPGTRYTATEYVCPACWTSADQAAREATS